MKNRFAPILAAAFVLAAPAAHSASLVYTGSLSGPAENPPNASPGTGTTTVTYDNSAHTLLVVVNFSGLTAPATAAHIHCCAAAPTNTAVAVPLTSFPNATSGSYTSTPAFDLTQTATYNASFVAGNGGTAAGAEAALAAGLAAGQAYVNIHTASFPGGEIRTYLAFSSPVQLQRFAAE